MDCFVASLLAMTKEISEAALSASPSTLRRLADHLRLPRQRNGRRQQDHQRLGAEDRERQIKARFRAIKSADDGAERGAARAGAIAHYVDRRDPPEEGRRRH